MTIELPPETRRRLLSSIRRFAAEELETDMGDLKAEIVLDYILREVGPSIYNAGVADAQKHVIARVEEASGTVYESEFTYWPR